MQKFEQFDAIIFDMDGTLVDSGQLHEVAWCQTLEKYGIPVEPKLMRSLAGVPTMETVEILAKHFGVKLTTSLTEINAFKESVVSNVAHEYVKPTALIDLAKHF